MFSPEFLSFLIKYQSKEYIAEEKYYRFKKNSEPQFGIHRFTKFAIVPVKVER